MSMDGPCGENGEHQMLESDLESGLKTTFDIDVVLEILDDFVRDMPAPSMFQLAQEGYVSPFEQLVACIISIRTMEETSLPVSRALFAAARTPREVIDLGERELERIIHTSTFADRKTSQIRAIAQIVDEQYGGDLPCDAAVMVSFSGVGPKCANLALGIACGQPTIPVDIHVHRVVNRWGYVSAKTPEKTLEALESVLPTRWRPSINRILMPFGKHHCTGVRPKCSTCPVLAMCRQVDVTSHR
jgi:endonuclease III